MKFKSSHFIAFLLLSILVGACASSPNKTLDLNLPIYKPDKSYQLSLAGVPTPSPGRCAVRAADLIGAWVSAKVPEKEAFLFADITGKTCQGTFEADVLPLFTTANLWYAGALSCRTCHGADIQISYARLDLSAYESILAGSGRSSAVAKGDDILGGGDWEKSVLYGVLNKGEMPPNRPEEVNPRGPIIYSGALK